MFGHTGFIPKDIDVGGRSLASDDHPPWQDLLQFGGMSARMLCRRWNYSSEKVVRTSGTPFFFIRILYIKSLMVTLVAKQANKSSDLSQEVCCLVLKAVHSFALRPTVMQRFPVKAMCAIFHECPHTIIHASPASSSVHSLWCYCHFLVCLGFREEPRMAKCRVYQMFWPHPHFFRMKLYDVTTVRIIMDEGAGRTTNVNNKKRKGASHHSGGNTARAGPARDLVEAAGRFIARVRTDYYLRNPPLAGHGHANEETLDDSTGEFSRLICSRFFPRLGCTGGNKLSDEGSCVRPPKNIGGKSKSKGKGSRGGSKSAKAKRAATAVTIDNAPVLSNHGAKGRASTGVRNGEAGGDHGMDEAETAALAAEVEEGEAFLRKFLAAKRHYEVRIHAMTRPGNGEVFAVPAPSL